MDTTERIIPTDQPKLVGMKDLFMDGAHAITRANGGSLVGTRHRDVFAGMVGGRPYYMRVRLPSYHKTTPGQRSWHVDLQNKELHPAISAVLEDDYRPTDWHQLLLEWPTYSTDMRLTYTRDERAGTREARDTLHVFFANGVEFLGFFSRRFAVFLFG